MSNMIIKAAVAAVIFAVASPVMANNKTPDPVTAPVSVNNTNRNVNDNANVNSNVAKGGQGGQGGTGVGVGVGVGGDSTSKSHSTSTSTASTGDSTASATGGNANSTIESGAVVVNVENPNGDDGTRDIQPVVVNELPASSAAPSFSSVCTSGAAGGDRSLQLSFGVTSPLCEALMMADANMALGNKDEAKKWVVVAGRHAKTKSAVGYIRHILTLGIL